MQSRSHLWCLMMMYPSLCGPCLAALFTYCFIPSTPESTGPFLWPCGMDHMLWPLLAPQEKNPYLLSPDFSSNHILRMRKHLSRPRCREDDRGRQKANGNVMTQQLQDVELNTGIRSMHEQGRSVHLFFRRNNKMLSAATKLRSFIQLSLARYVHHNEKKQGEKPSTYWVPIDAWRSSLPKITRKTLRRKTSVLLIDAAWCEGSQLKNCPQHAVQHLTAGHQEAWAKLPACPRPNHPCSTSTRPARGSAGPRADSLPSPGASEG